MGKVYRAVQKSIGKLVALKVLKKSRQHRPEAVARFLEEARIVARLSHAGIVSVHGLGRTLGGGYFLVMDLVAGSNLSMLVSARRIEISEAIEWVAQVAEAVEHAHRTGVIHCDLKPANVLLNESGRALVTDFGLARSLTMSDSRPLDVEGTVGFMAPEQFDSQLGEIGAHTDVYGLGALMYSLVAGVAPFSGPTLLQVAAKVMSGLPAAALSAFRVDVPDELVALCRECLDPAAVRRPQSAAEVARRLRQLS